MTASAVVMGISGAALEFAPHEVLRGFGAEASGAAPLLLQIAGALYLGFAMTNWMAKTVLIGGIYARPLAVGNFAHFTIGALALLKYAFAAEASLPIWTLAAVYALFAAAFARVFFTHPLKNKE